MVPMPELRDRWLLIKILLDSFFDREPVGGGELAVRANKDDDAPLSQLLHQTVFFGHNQRNGVTISPRSILRMRIQRNEVAWTDIRFESIQILASEVLSVPAMVKILAEAMVRKALDVSKSTFIIMSHKDLKF